MEKVFMAAYDILYALELFLVGQGIFHNRVREKEKYGAMAGLYLLVIIPAVFFLSDARPVAAAMNVILFLVLFQGSVFSRLVHFAGTYLWINLAESLIFGIGGVFLRQFAKRREISFLESGAASLLLAVCITAFMLFLMNKKAVQNFISCFGALKWFQNLVVFLMAWSGILILGALWAAPDHRGVREIGGRQLFCLAVFMGAAFVGVVLLVFNVYGKDYYLTQSQVREEMIDAWRRNIQRESEQDRELRRFRHDISSQFRFFGCLLAEGKTGEALAHLKVTENHFKELEEKRFHTGNGTLDLLISQKARDAEEKGVAIEFQGKLEQPDFMDAYDLCIIVSNVLDNGIEACERQKAERPKIRVCVLTHGNTVLFQFTNPAAVEMYQAVKNGRTTKVDKRNHGFGMENVKRVLDRNGGKIEYFYREGKLTVEIFVGGKDYGKFAGN